MKESKTIFLSSHKNYLLEYKVLPPIQKRSNPELLTDAASDRHGDVRCGQPLQNARDSTKMTEWQSTVNKSSSSPLVYPQRVDQKAPTSCCIKFKIIDSTAIF